ncbi:hypothetical protein A2609_02680 [Candidatus Kaiserbacteria bacterium RIFOXYD1_FULL_47_14]|uniref:HD domain-containing protein n=1 Tax=Candidatus Kaiserbacteria bacterium RIFOXYD1_FULL_47_14 TaxID=1798533 RepID=A0A1F6G529_9BACT|nr:MAG: hypothetical protein A2609_02680 [Candidatus Kaiserbacteria bacterium RIFOXYD1_FULL_47_14]
MHEQKRPPGYELFFAPLQVVLNPTEFESVKFAYLQAKSGLAKQTREDGSRAFDHPKFAAWIYMYELGGRDPHTIIIILLHDIEEDTYLLSPYRISLNFSKEIALDIVALTKLPKGKETVEEYLARIIDRGPRVTLAKLCDRLHNLRTLRGCSEEKLARQIEETQRYHLPLLIPALNEYGEPWTTYADSMEQKIKEAISELGNDRPAPK